MTSIADCHHALASRIAVADYRLGRSAVISGACVKWKYRITVSVGLNE